MPAKGQSYLRQFELVDLVRAYDPSVDEALLNKAYIFSIKAHGEQMRHSGDPYYAHPIEVAGILAGLHLDIQMEPCQNSGDLNGVGVIGIARMAHLFPMSFDGENIGLVQKGFINGRVIGPHKVDQFKLAEIALSLSGHDGLYVTRDVHNFNIGRLNNNSHKKTTCYGGSFRNKNFGPIIKIGWNYHYRGRFVRRGASLALTFQPADALRRVRYPIEARLPLRLACHHL